MLPTYREFYYLSTYLILYRANLSLTILRTALLMRLKPSLPVYASRSKKANTNSQERGTRTDC